jgi:hypothetical protein
MSPGNVPTPAVELHLIAVCVLKRWRNFNYRNMTSVETLSSLGLVCTEADWMGDCVEFSAERLLEIWDFQLPQPCRFQSPASEKLTCFYLHIFYCLSQIFNHFPVPRSLSFMFIFSVVMISSLISRLRHYRLFWFVNNSKNVDFGLLSHLSPEDGDNMFIRNVGVYLQVHVFLQPRRQTSTAVHKWDFRFSRRRVWRWLPSGL